MCLVLGNQRKSFLHPVFEAFIEPIAEQKVALQSSSLSHRTFPTRFVLVQRQLFLIFGADDSMKCSQLFLPTKSPLVGIHW